MDDTSTSKRAKILIISIATLVVLITIVLLIVIIVVLKPKTTKNGVSGSVTNENINSYTGK